MDILTAENITIQYREKPLLDKVNLYIDQADKIGIIGINGTGKSTLLKILAGEETPDSGRITKSSGIRMGYLPQVPSYDPGTTILEQVLAGAPENLRGKKEYEAKSILTRLGFSDFSLKTGMLSGGQKKRVALAAVLAVPCDILLLDEPTNHLDGETILWLENYLQKFTGAVVMVTHDRYFLERVVSRIVEVDRGSLELYPANYTQYLNMKSSREEMAAASARKKQALLRREAEWISRGARARGTKSRSRLERYEALSREEESSQAGKLEIRSLSSRLGRKIMEIENLSKAWDGRLLFQDFSYNVLRNDRIGIIGGNGCGKTTLLQILAGALSPDGGRVILGETVKIGYFCQETHDMPQDMRVIDYIREVGEIIHTADGDLTASQLLETFLFTGDMQWSPIGRLSGGEQRRLFLLRILMAAPNILLLDEPTNDLDIQTLTILEDYIGHFEGVVIAVSHDRYFLDKIADRVFVFQPDGHLQQHTGGYSDWLDSLELTDRQSKDKQTSPVKNKDNSSASPTPSPSRSATASRLRFSYNEQREFETIDGVVAELEEKLASLDKEQAACASDYARLQTLLAEKAAVETELERKMERWLYLHEMAEKIAAQSPT